MGRGVLGEGVCGWVDAVVSDRVTSFRKEEDGEGDGNRKQTVDTTQSIVLGCFLLVAL